MQPLTRCENGHYYDSQKHHSCPFCGVQNLDLDIKKTMAKRPAPTDGDLPAPGSASSPAMPGAEPADTGKTVGIYKKKTSVDPVAGWLVAIKGPDKGRDYRIVPEKNFIGRSESMDISITGDNSISRDNHAVISYNPKKNSFRIYQGESKSLVYLNDEELITPEELKAYDIIELGQTTLRFVPFCGEGFIWTEET